MKTKKLQLFRIGLLGFATAAILFANGGFNFQLNKTAYANGDLTVDWGTPVDGDPIFVVNNMAPGDPCETRTVNVLNSAAVVREVGVRGEKTSEVAALGSVLEIEIEKVGTGSIYGPVTLNQFFIDSAGANALSLSSHNSGQAFDYTFTVCFPESAGNEFQNANVVFDLFIGLVIPTPEDCDDIDFVGSPIFGTSGNDNIKGTTGNDLIFALEGNDKVDGKGGDDCIIGGDGNDNLKGGSGDDVIIGGTGNDKIDGGSHQDIISGGDGNDEINAGSHPDFVDGGGGDDEIEGGSGEDQIQGGEGNDEIEGGSDADEVFGGGGNDIIDGGSGNDQLFGEGGNDSIKGASNNDLLDGGIGTNTLNGQSGTDICINGPTITNCELP